MKTVNALIEKLYKEAKDKMVKKLAQDKGQYTELCKNLLIQVSTIGINKIVGTYQVDGTRGPVQMQERR